MVKFQQWDGKRFKLVTPFMAGDRELVRKMVEETAAKYAKEKNITPRDCAQGEADPISASGRSRRARERAAREGPPRQRRSVPHRPHRCTVPLTATDRTSARATHRALPRRAYLSVNNIEVIYDHVILVLKGVSLEVPRGQDRRAARRQRRRQDARR